MSSWDILADYQIWEEDPGNPWFIAIESEIQVTQSKVKIIVESYQLCDLAKIVFSYIHLPIPFFCMRATIASMNFMKTKWNSVCENAV